MLAVLKSWDATLGYQVKTMAGNEKSTNSFTWSSWEIYYTEEQVVSKIDAPNMSNNRGQYQLTDNNFAKYKSYF